ncbi:cytochrome b [Labrys monachus]|uniref:Cytochrome b561 n=1 Tax=Labrys monachus TaxID=217067 RepID=A0ABU0FLL0_9HYPH|nr:cytochrome b [Labrys monachus]MDQ0395499.1 cytochrome b561 [Labrys monachus]
MTTLSPRRRWSPAGQALHWLSAALILFMLGLGLVMVEFVEDPGRRFELYQLHKTCGAFVFLLLALRTAWRLFAVAPSPPATMPGHERLLSRTVHVVLYLMILAITLSGYVMISSSPLPLPVELPGGLAVPNLIAPDYGLSETMKTLHHRLAWVLLGLVALHVLAALKHHFWDRDDVLRQMLPLVRARREGRSPVDRPPGGGLPAAERGDR